MNAEKPLVSVLMTAYNREPYIGLAIESVLSSIYTHFELIIVDDGSTDQTVSVARSYAAKDKRISVYVNEQNLGDYPNRNKAASYAKGKYIKYLDSDDLMYPHTLFVMVTGMERFPEAGFGLASVPSMEKPFPVCISSREAYLEHFYGFGHFDRAPGSVIIRKAVFDRVGGFTGKRMIGDQELWFILARESSLVKLPRDLVWDRVHTGQESQSAYARKNYAMLRKQVLAEAFEHPRCPLNVAEKEAITKMLLKKRIKSILKNVV